MTSNFDTREAYLVAAINEFSRHFAAINAPLPKVRVACGWPSSRGTANKNKALGECWDKSASTDEVAQIFISPFLCDLLDVHPETPSGKDGMGVLPVLAHELVHAAVGNKEGHGKVFKKTAKAIGLEGKMTSTHAGEQLRKICAEISMTLGQYPHAQIIPGLGRPVGKKKQGTRMIKCECPDCGYTVRTTRKWLEVGAPICPKHSAMTFDEAGEDEGDEDAED